jgi:hypothetical protein
VGIAILPAKKKFILLYGNFFLAKSAAGCHNSFLLPVVVCSPLYIIEEWEAVTVEAMDVGL